MKEQISNEIYKYFADIIYSKTGISYPEKDYYRLDSRLNTLMKHYDCETVADVYSLYRTKQTPDMLAFLINICTNNETYFFRDEKPFHALTKGMVPEVLKSNPSGKINIWSCASSTGQEPLSILMSIYEDIPTFHKSQLEFHATDISTKALDKAKSGVYSSLDIQRGLPIKLLLKYFEKIDETNWKIKDNILSQVKYDEFNLLKDNFKTNYYDIIFCRNVLIYQEKDNKQNIMNNIYDSLKPGGFLVFGAGESLIGMTHQFQQVQFEGAMLFQKPMP